MQFEAIQNLMQRVNQIQQKIGLAPEYDLGGTTPSPSFEATLQQAMTGGGQSIGGQTLPSGLYPGYQQPTGEAAWLANLALTSPQMMIEHDGHQMQTQTAYKWNKLKGLLSQMFPNREITVTSTTDGKHSSPAHPEGKAIDFVVDGLTKDESLLVEKMSRDAGFKPYNEYINTSTYKTGDHMHIELQS